MADKKLEEVRTQFVEKVNKAVICTVLDDLLEKGVLNDEEVEKVKLESVTQEQARTLIDGVRKKGPKASLIAIKSIRARDVFLAEQLGLTAFLKATPVASAPAPLTSVAAVAQGLTRSALETPLKKSKKKATYRKRSRALQHQQSKCPRCRGSTFPRRRSFLSSEAMATSLHRGQTTISPLSHPSTTKNHLSTPPHCRVSPILSVNLPPIPRTPSPTIHGYQSPIPSDDDVSDILHQDEPRSDEQQGKGVPVNCPPFNPQDQYAPSQLSMDDSASLLLKPEELMQPDSEAESENTSLPSPVDTIGDPSAPSPTDDLTPYNDQLISMAKSLGLEYMFTEPKLTDPITKALCTPDSGLIMLPLLQGIYDIAMRIWAKPSSTPDSAKKLENLYKIREDGPSFLFQHPKANSWVLEVLPEKGRSGTHSAPLDKEGRRLDELGRKTYSSGAMGLRVSNLTAIMGRYQMYLWDCMSEFANSMPEDKKHEVMSLLREGQKLGKLQLNAARHEADCHSRTMASGITLHRHSWLRSSDLPQYIRAKVEDLPFEGQELFSAKTDDVLKDFWKNKLTAKSLGTTSSTSQPYRQGYFPRSSSGVSNVRPTGHILPIQAHEHVR